MAKTSTTALRTRALLQRGGVALLLITLAAARSQAQPAERPSLSIQVPSEPPAGFEHERLLQRVAVYLGPIVAIAGVDADASAKPSSAHARSPRFVVLLDWPQGTMTPLQGRVSDTSFSPPKHYDFDVSAAESWGEFERLVALKLWSVLRIAMAEPAPPAAIADETAEPTGPSGDRSARAMLELGGGVVAWDGFETPRAAGAIRAAFMLQRWSFGVAATLTWRSFEGRDGAASDAFETTWAASVRYDVLRSDRSRWVLQAGSDFGLIVARVTGTRLQQERTAYAVSPLTSALVLGGYRLAADGSVMLSFGPVIDVLWNRSAVTARGVRVYDSGRIRQRAEMKLGLAF